VRELVGSGEGVEGARAVLDSVELMKSSGSLPSRALGAVRLGMGTEHFRILNSLVYCSAHRSPSLSLTSPPLGLLGALSHDAARSSGQLSTSAGMEMRSRCTAA